MRTARRPASPCSRARPKSRRARPFVVVAVAAAALLGAGGAAAHGDPSTHAFEGDSLYPAVADRPAQAVELRLIGLLRAAAARGYPIKVALVANANDLALDSTMLYKPQQYAEFVQWQLGGARMLDAPLVVISPYGVGIAGRARRDGDLRRVDRDEARALARGVAVTRGAHGDDLARAATTLVRRLAAAGGHPLPARVPPASAVWTGRTASSSGLPHVPPAVVFALGAFLASVLGYELWTRRRGLAA
jgi:hypothetical protein